MFTFVFYDHLSGAPCVESITIGPAGGWRAVGGGTELAIFQPFGVDDELSTTVEFATPEKLALAVHKICHALRNGHIGCDLREYQDRELLDPEGVFDVRRT